MAQTTIEQPPAPTRDVPSAGAARPELGAAVRRYPEAMVALALLAISTVIVLWADTRPGFDVYGWLVWGHQTVAGSLNTNAAPSWKPLPYLFTAPYALAGHYELWLWMITSVAIALSGLVFAARIAYRVTAHDPGTGGAQRIDRRRHRAALAAGAFAALGLLGVQDYAHYVLSFQSDPMIIALCLGAIDCHLSGRPRWAYTLGVLASLGRPEVWLFLGLYTIWAWRAIPAMRWLIIAELLAMAALWFGIPALSSRSPFVAGDNALGSGRALHSDKVWGTIDRFLDLHETPLELLALVSGAIALWRRDRVTLALAAGTLAWVITEVAFSLHGWAGLPRYMYGAGGVMVVIAGIGVGRLLSADWLSLSAARSKLTGAAARYLGPALAAVAVIALIPPAISDARGEHRDLHVQRQRTHEINRLAGIVTRLGGPARFHPCGEPLTRLEYQTIVAWTLHLNVATVGWKYGPAVHSHRPIVLFTPLVHGGWKIEALHQRLASCRRL